VDSIVSGGDGERFDPGHGRLMKEWVALEPSHADEWLRLATEAMEFRRGPVGDDAARRGRSSST
jgi:hypothetical protein